MNVNVNKDHDALYPLLKTMNRCSHFIHPSQAPPFCYMSPPKKRYICTTLSVGKRRKGQNERRGHECGEPYVTCAVRGTRISGVEAQTISVCMCMYTYVYIPKHVYVCRCVSCVEAQTISVCMCMRMYTCIHECACMCTNLNMCMCVYVLAHTISACMCMYT